MLRLTTVFVTVLALAVLVVPLADAEQAAAKPPKVVTITAHCPTNENGPFNFHMVPWLRVLAPGDNTKWNLAINDSKNNKIIVEAKGSEPWPYPVRKHEGQGSATATDMDTGADGYYRYSITIFCDSEKIIIDPRVRVR